MWIITAQHWILRLCCIATATFVEFSYSITTSLSLTKDGNIENASSTPTCRSGERINLLSYTYLTSECRGDCVRMDTKNLSQEAEMRLHNACSFKEICTNVTLPFEEFNQFNRNTLKISYRCEGRTTLFINPCAATVTHYNASFHLKVADPFNLYKDCQCFIKDGEFRIYLNDLRLQSSCGDTCSLAKLQVNSDIYTCDRKSATIGSVFNKEIGGLLPRGFISLVKPRLNGQPRMLWLTIQPIGRVSISCASSTWEEDSTTVHQSTSEYLISKRKEFEHPNLNSSAPVKIKGKDETTSMQTIIIVVYVGGGVVVVTAATVIIVLNRRRCQQSVGKDDYIEPVYRRSVPNQDDAPPGQSKPTFSKHPEGASGSSSSLRPTHNNGIERSGINKTMNFQGDDPYYLELREVPSETIYERIPETHVVYEHIQNDREEKETEYAELDSDNPNIGTYCVPYSYLPEKSAHTYEMESVVEELEAPNDRVKTENDGYLKPIVTRPKLEKEPL